jgi:enamine deaminase RidA (YjgF/YER057c/UK114 family)
MMIEEQLAALGLSLPNPPVPVGNYRPVQVGNLVFTSGQTARINGVCRCVGVIGRDVTMEDAYLSARDSALNCLACVKSVVGSLDRIVRVIKVVGFVNAIDGFTEQPAVINSAPDLLVKLFGERGRHARSAIGVGRCPRTSPSSSS